MPFYVFAFTTDNFFYAGLGLVIGGFVKYGYITAQYTIGQGVVSMRMRAMSTAVLLFVANLIGYGFGPLFIGGISDIFYKWRHRTRSKRRELAGISATHV